MLHETLDDLVLIPNPVRLKHRCHGWSCAGASLQSMLLAASAKPTCLIDSDWPLHRVDKMCKCACRLCWIFLIRQEKDLTNWLVFLPWNLGTETVSQAWALKLHTHPHEFQWALSVSTLRSLKCAKRKQKSAYVSLLPKWKTGLQNVKTRKYNIYIYISSSRCTRDLDNSCKAACTGWISTNRTGPPTKCQAVKTG